MQANEKIIQATVIIKFRVYEILTIHCAHDTWKKKNICR